LCHIGTGVAASPARQALGPHLAGDVQPVLSLHRRRHQSSAAGPGGAHLAGVEDVQVVLNRHGHRRHPGRMAVEVAVAVDAVALALVFMGVALEVAGVVLPCCRRCYSASLS
jgi:hypothetical protein